MKHYLQKTYYYLFLSLSLGFSNVYGQFKRGIPPIWVGTSAPSMSADFRKVKWGMSQKQVVAAESGYNPIVLGTGTVHCLSVFVQRQSATLDYAFENGQLVQAVLHFSPDTRDGDNWIDDYKDLNNSLTKKYKQPVSNRTIYKQKSTFDEGYALLSGDVSFIAKWAAGKTIIVHELSNKKEFRLCRSPFPGQFLGQFKLPSVDIEFVLFPASRPRLYQVIGVS